MLFHKGTSRKLFGGDRFFSDRARWIDDFGREVVGRTRPLTLRLRQRLRTVRIALKIALARNASPAKLSPKCQSVYLLFEAIHKRMQVCVEILALMPVENENNL